GLVGESAHAHSTPTKAAIRAVGTWTITAFRVDRMFPSRERMAGTSSGLARDRRLGIGRALLRPSNSIGDVQPRCDETMCFYVVQTHLPNSPHCAQTCATHNKEKPAS